MATKININKTDTKVDKLQEIKDLLEESKKMREQISELTKDIVPKEFESYADYYMIHTFKRGRSESGKVNMYDLRSRNHTKYYQRIKRTSKNSQNGSPDPTPEAGKNVPQNGQLTPPDSTSSTLDILNKLDKDGNKTTESTNNKKSETPGDCNWEGITGDELEETFDAIPGERSSEVSADIKADSIIGPDSKADIGEVGFRRRSSRISKKQQQERVEKDRNDKLRKQLLHQAALKNLQNQTKQTSLNEEIKSEEVQASELDEENPDIKDLYESLVPKIKSPTRRSDWILPPRLKFTPEKQMRTRIVVDSIKVHELIDTERIAKVLSHFEGGVAGIRKTFGTNRGN